jgi:pimeloyl-ACP methyl ester carboxylesterase
MSARFVFVHGGPGFNSLPEQTLLGPPCEAAGHSIAFWNEPSRLRPDGDAFEAERAFERWLASAERFVLQSALRPAHLIAHSSAVHAALEIARRHPHCLASVVLVAPSIDPFAGFRRVLRVAHADFAETQPALASVVASAIARTRVLFDDPMREGLQLAARDERLFTHYFANADQFAATAAVMSRPEAQFDGESFFAVMSDFAGRHASLLSTAPVPVPVLALFGSADPITPMDDQVGALRAAAPGACIERVDGCSHWLHLDRPRRFLEIVTRWLSGF